MSKQQFQKHMKAKPGLVFCDLCNAWVGPNTVCNTTKNGYCQVSRFIAARDAKTFNMHPPRYQEEKT